MHRTNKETWTHFLEQTPGLIIMTREDAVQLAELLMDSAQIMHHLVPFLNPSSESESTAIKGINERVEDLIQVHANLKKALEN